MSIKGKVKESNTGLRVGATVLEPLVVNPTKQQFKEILGFNRDKEPEYLTEIKGVPSLRLDIWARDTQTGAKLKIQQLLQNTVSQLTDGKIRYINKFGLVSFWVNDLERLSSFFKNNDPWIARKGEADLYSFLKAHTGKLHKDSDCFVDWDRLMKGDVEELNAIKNEAFHSNVFSTLTVRTAMVNGQAKDFQSVYHKDFLRDTLIACVGTTPEDPNHPYNKYVRQMLHPTAGCTEFFGKDKVLKLAHEYNPADNPLSSDSPIISSGAPAAMPATAAMSYSQAATAQQEFEEEDFGEDDFPDFDGELDDSY